MGMTDKQDEQPTQKTPQGAEIPVPKREDFLRDLKKVAPPTKPRSKPDENEGEHR